MYAIILDGPRQLKVSEGEEITVDLRAEANPGDEIKFDKVLCISGEAGVKIGQPELTGAVVTAKVVSSELGEKLVVQKFRRRKNSRRKTGHRQLSTLVKIEKITG